MTYTDYPQPADLEAFLISSGAIPSPISGSYGLIDLNSALSSAIADWEQDTGLIPFLKDAADVTVIYDPPGHQDGHGLWGTQRGVGRSLYLPGFKSGAVFSSITSIVTSYMSVTQPGTTLVENTDYWLQPPNYALNNRPIEHVFFGYRSWGTINSIRITGKRGWPVVPANVWQAVIKKAAVTLIPQIDALKRGGLIQWHEGDGTSETYGANGLFGEQMQVWTKAYTDTVSKYAVVLI